MRVMFFSPHCLIDPGSGAAVATLALWRTLSEAGIPCQALCAGKLDLPPETPIETLLQGAAGLSFSSHAVRFEGHEAVRYDGVPERADPEIARIQVLALAGGRPGHWPVAEDGLCLPHRAASTAVDSLHQERSYLRARFPPGRQTWTQVVMGRRTRRGPRACYPGHATGSRGSGRIPSAHVLEGSGGRSGGPSPRGKTGRHRVHRCR